MSLVIPPSERGDLGSAVVDFKIVIPARYDSNRFPGKPLALIAGKPMIEHVWQRAMQAGAEQVLIATDDNRIREVAEGFGAEVIMTDHDHDSGSDRLAEVVSLLGWADDTIVVNLQGDEPLTPADMLTQVATNLSIHKDADITTLCTKIASHEEFEDPNVVKVVHDNANFALYFSRAPIPFIRDKKPDQPPIYALRHIGIYGYRAEFLKRYTNMSIGRLEEIECLEQLRALRHNARIHVAHTVKTPGPGVDVPEDIARVEALLARH